MKAFYLHLPFCNRICSYCDFAKVYYNEKLVDQYLDSLEEEFNKVYQKDPIKTIYLGGGSPSSLNLKQLAKLFTIIDQIDQSSLREFTFEFNLEEISEEKLKYLKEKGVNRLSIGVQTVNPKFHKFLNRYSTKELVIEKINLARKYFDNLSVDLIFALENQSLDDLKEELKFIKSLQVDHLSTYALIIEDHTLLKIKKTKELDDELEAKMYEVIKDELKEYNHYEISNFAKEGKESLHNLAYWNNEEYYGIGLSASFYLDNIRGDNTKNLSKYLQGEYLQEKTKLSLEETIENHLILAFRKTKGINKEEFFKKYLVNLKDSSIIKQLLQEDLLEETAEFLKIKDEYLFLSNNILYRILGNIKDIVKEKI